MSLNKIYEYVAEPGLTLIIGLVSIKILLFIAGRMLKRSGSDEALYKFILKFTKIICLIILSIMILDSLGVETKSIIGVFGLSGAAIALSLKDSLGNVAGGIVLLFTHPFSKDDYVKIGETEGRIEHIDIMLTSLITEENKTVTIPNGIVSNSVITNFSREG